MPGRRWKTESTLEGVTHALDQLGCVIVVRDSEDRIIYANQRLLDWSGYDAAELDGQHLKVLLPPEVRDLMDHEVVSGGDRRARISALCRKDGAVRPVLALPAPLHDLDGERIGIISVVVDLGEVQMAKRTVPLPGDELAATLLRISDELQAASLTADSVAGPRVLPLSAPELRDLSEREREILALLVGGTRVPAIAEQLFISPHTVRNHLKAIYRKVGVSSQSELIERVKALAAR